MSSSTFEVTETEKDLSFGLETCDENGIGLSAQVDGEVQKDHTYTKEPDGSEEDEEKPDGEEAEESEKIESTPDKNRSSRNSKNSKEKSPKKKNPKSTKAKKEASPKKEIPPPKKSKAKKEVLAEESNKSEESSKSDKVDEKNGTEDQAKSSKRGKKRKIEEKENVIDRSIVEEVQNINEGDSSADVITESPSKKKKTADKPIKAKKATKSKSVPTVEDGEDNQNLPKGWIRKTVVRKSGKTAGQIDIYIYSPDGIKFRSRPDIAAYLARTKSNLKLEDFNFSKKKIEDAPVKANPKKEKSTPAAKPKSITEKKKPQSSGTPVKKGSKLLVKLNFTPKTKKGKNVKKTPEKQKKGSKSSVKNTKVSGSNSKVSKKKKTT